MDTTNKRFAILRIVETEVAIKKAAGTAVEYPFGTVIASPEFPGYAGGWAIYNFLPGPDDDVEELLSLVKPEFATAGRKSIRLYVSPDVAGEAAVARIDEDLYILGFERKNLRPFAWVKTMKHKTLPGITIEPADWDADDLAQLYSDGDGSAARGEQARIHRLRDERLPEYTTWIARLDGAPAGRLAFYNGQVVGRLRSLFVRPELRRKGVGSALVTHHLALSKDAGNLLCGLITEKDNPARYMYTELGFTEAGEVRCYEGPLP